MRARVAKLVDAEDLKSPHALCAGGCAVVQVGATGRISVEIGAPVDVGASVRCADVAPVRHQTGTGTGGRGDLEHIRALLPKYARGGR